MRSALFGKNWFDPKTPDFVNALVQDSITSWPPSIRFLGCDQEAPFFILHCNSLVRCAIHAYIFFTNICVSEITAFVIFIKFSLWQFIPKFHLHLDISTASIVVHLKILMGILTPSGGKIKISIVNLLGSFYPNKKLNLIVLQNACISVPHHTL